MQRMMSADLSMTTTAAVPRPDWTSMRASKSISTVSQMLQTAGRGGGGKEGREMYGKSVTKITGCRLWIVHAMGSVRLGWVVD